MQSIHKETHYRAAIQKKKRRSKATDVSVTFLELPGPNIHSESCNPLMEETQNFEELSKHFLTDQNDSQNTTWTQEVRKEAKTADLTNSVKSRF